MPVIGEFDRRIDALEGTRSPASTWTITRSRDRYFFEAMAAGPEYLAAMTPGDGRQVFEVVRATATWPDSGSCFWILQRRRTASCWTRMDIQSSATTWVHEDRARMRVAAAEGIRVMFAAGAKRVLIPQRASAWGRHRGARRTLPDRPQARRTGSRNASSSYPIEPRSPRRTCRAATRWGPIRKNSVVGPRPSRLREPRRCTSWTRASSPAQSAQIRCRHLYLREAPRGQMDRRIHGGKGQVMRSAAGSGFVRAGTTRWRCWRLVCLPGPRRAAPVPAPATSARGPSGKTRGPDGPPDRRTTSRSSRSTASPWTGATR